MRPRRRRYAQRPVTFLAVRAARIRVALALFRHRHRIALPVSYTHPVLDLVRPLRNDSVWMNRVEIGITVDFSLAATPKVLFAINPGKQSAVDVPVYGGNADRTVRFFQRPSSCYGSRRPELLQVLNDVCLELRILLKGGVAKTLPLWVGFSLGRKRMVIAFLAFVSLQFLRDRRRRSVHCT